VTVTASSAPGACKPADGSGKAEHPGGKQSGDSLVKGIYLKTNPVAAA